MPANATKVGDVVVSFQWGFAGVVERNKNDVDVIDFGGVRQNIGGLSPLLVLPVPKQAIIDELRADRERLTVEVAGLRGAHDALVDRVDELAAVARDWLNVMEDDKADCTCDDGDVCPLCRCKSALGMTR